MNKQNKILVVGFGSDILTDDAVSARLIKDIELSDLFLDIDCCNFITSSMDMIENLCGYKSLLLIDAIKSGKYTIGGLTSLKLDEVDCTLHLSNFHDHSFSEILETARKCGYKISSDVHVYGIEVEESHVFSAQLSENLKLVYSDVKNKATEVIRNLIKNLNIEIEL